jgi:GNAT superfamily N-acetyltransferase
MASEIATFGDIRALTDLLSVLFSQEAEFTPDPEAQRRGLTRVISDPRVGMVLVARQGGQVVGMVNLLFTVSTALGERVVLLEDRVLSPHVRGSGVGTRLLSDAIALVRDQGFKRITLLTDRSNESAQRFYSRHGFVISTMVPMRLSLS